MLKRWSWEWNPDFGIIKHSYYGQGWASELVALQKAHRLNMFLWGWELLLVDPQKGGTCWVCFKQLVGSSIPTTRGHCCFGTLFLGCWFSSF